MTQNKTARSLHACAVLLLAGGLPPGGLPGGASPEHVAAGEAASVTTLWRSERALDQYAQEGLRIVEAVCAAVPTEEERFLRLGIAETCFDLRWLEDPTLKQADTKRRRRRRKAGKTDEDNGPGAPEQPLLVSGLAAMDPPAAVVSVAPKVHDRVMFGTGLPPTTRWALALRAAHECGAMDPLAAALAGLKDASFAADVDLGDPFVSSAWVDLKGQLLAASEGIDGAEAAAIQAQALAALSATYEAPSRLAFDSGIPTQASTELVARHVLASGLGVADVMEAQPQWILEGGAIGRHPYGWHAVATRRTDALALSVDARTSDDFVLRTTFVAFSNDLKVPAQADLVFGDANGERYMIICNTSEGVYIFRQPGHGEPVEAVAEKKELLIPPGRPIEVVVTWKDSNLVINVGGTELAAIVLPEDAMAGSYGFGAHTGSTVMFRDLVFD